MGRAFLNQRTPRGRNCTLIRGPTAFLRLATTPFSSLPRSKSAYSTTAARQGQHGAGPARLHGIRLAARSRISKKDDACTVGAA
jgi:hypothetical protein